MYRITYLDLKISITKSEIEEENEGQFLETVGTNFINRYDA